MPSVAIKGYIYNTPLLSPSEKGVLLKNHPKGGWPGSVRRSKTLDLHNEELLLVLGVSVRMSHREQRSKQATTHRELFVYGLSH